MLISSHRHRPEDLEIWAELEAADLVYGAVKRDRIANLVTHAASEIARFRSLGQCCVSLSWGKDSLVLAWIVAQFAPDLPCVCARMRDVEPEGVDRVRDEFLARFPLRYSERDTGDKFSTMLKSKDCKPGRAMIDTLDAIQREHGTNRYITGIRAEESRTRAMRVWDSRVKISSTPIGRFKLPDIFAIVATEQLPLHSVYGMLGGGRYDRSQVRLCNLAGPRGTGNGRREWEREYFQDRFNRAASTR